MTQTLFLIVFFSAFLGLLGLMVWRVVRTGTTKAPAEVLERLEELGPKRKNRADCYGIDGADLDGHGNLVLTDREVAFLRWEPAGEWRLPLERVSAFDSRPFYPAGERERAGGRVVVGTGKRRFALRIFWDGGYALFWTPERLQWLKALEDATGKERGAEGIDVPLRPGGGT